MRDQCPVGKIITAENLPPSPVRILVIAVDTSTLLLKTDS
jgi:hypothetical protein